MQQIIEKKYDSSTTNGASTYSTSNSKNVDLFFRINASRGKDLTEEFLEAFAENQELSIRILQYSRDIRGGAGEREIFKKLFSILVQFDKEIAGKILNKIPEIGRWDEVLLGFDTPLERQSLQMIARALNEKNSLCAKWMPRQGKEANKIRSYIKLDPKTYRQLLARLSNAVEQKMCANEWEKINYSHVPSVASSRYQSAFKKHDADEYNTFKEKLAKGESKINSSTVYPYDIIRSHRNGDKEVSEQQWKSLPNYLKDSNNILPIVDVSGSMECKVSGEISALDVAVSLGLYISERNNGFYKDKFITFSENPTVQTVSGNLSERIEQIESSDWGMSTDIHSAFKLILDAAVINNLSEKEMPSIMLVLSDMEFNAWVLDEGDDASALDMMRHEYTNAGYKMPTVVFWNIAARKGNIPVRFDESGTVLVSGFSPSILKSILSTNEFTPETVMLNTVMVDRYNFY